MKLASNQMPIHITFNSLHAHYFSFMHHAYHIGPPSIHLAIDEVLLGVEYFTTSTI